MKRRLNTKPRGRTVFEYECRGTYEPEAYGYYLYFDGRLYLKDEDLLKPGSATYTLLLKDPSLADEVKRFIKQNQQEIETFPAKVESELVGVTDAADVSVKFLSKCCSGYAMDFYPEAAPIFAIAAKIAAIFRKHGRPIKDLEPSIEAFVEKWTDEVKEIKDDPTGRKLCRFLDNVEFDSDCCRYGFEMDAFNAVNRLYGDGSLEPKRDISLGRMFSIVKDKQALGNAIFSKWRYYNHWAYDAASEFNADWFLAAFKRLEKLDDAVPRYTIKNARCGRLDLEWDGPLSIAEVELQSESGETIFLNLTDIYRDAICLKTNKSIFERQMKLEEDCDEFYDKLDDCRMDDYASYDDIFGNPDGDFYDEFRYLVYLNSLDDASEYIAQTLGKRACSIEIPKTELEGDWENGELDDDEGDDDPRRVCVVYGPPSR